MTAPPADSLPADPPDQQAAIAFLSRPASYGLAGGRVERIASHCSIVFLAADRAYKLKRAIRYAALDYTTLAARRAACEAELTLNRRTAPALYLAVRRITRDEAGRLAFDGPGETLDCVVMMRRFAQADLLDAMAPAGALTPALMRALGAGIARFHLAAARRPDHGGSAAVARVIADNARELARFTRPADGPAPGGPLLEGEAVAALGRRAEASLASLAPLLDRRRASGWVRRCHGDLRLANICLFRGRPTLFDCIEFSDEIGCIDTLHDLAFLLMDLELRGRRDLANALFNADQDAAPDPDWPRALPLFLSLRAATRCYALAGKACRQTDPAEMRAFAAAAAAHLAASRRFLDPAPPRLMFLAGPDDAATRACAARRAAAASSPPGARILRLAGAEGPRWREAAAALAAGGSVLLVASPGDAPARARAAALAAGQGMRLDADADTDTNNSPPDDPDG